VDEYVCSAAIRLNEAIPFGRTEPFNAPQRHQADIIFRRMPSPAPLGRISNATRARNSVAPKVTNADPERENDQCSAGRHYDYSQLPRASSNADCAIVAGRFSSAWKCGLTPSGILLSAPYGGRLTEKDGNDALQKSEFVTL